MMSAHVAPPSPAGELSDEQHLNDRIEYTMWSVFAHGPDGLSTSRLAAIDEVEALLEDVRGRGVRIRGLYRLSGMRADADWMIWWHAPTITALQDAYEQLRHTALGRASMPVWSAAGLHRPAEFSATHIPAYLRGLEPARYVTVYPFVRSTEWYLLPESERRQMLIDHGAASHDYPDVLSNTVASFGLGDYEWLLALEADELHRLVDLMRTFRYTDARRHVREETPFFTGERVSVGALVTAAP